MITKELYNEQISSYKQKVEATAFEYLEKVEVPALREPFKYLLEGGGKRIRPILAILGCGIAGGSTDDAIDVALSMEVLHNFTLVHDDIMDSSPIRRGRPTIHMKWDISTGVLVGDLMIGYACKLMPKKNMSRIFEIQKLFNDAIIEVCIGQAYDIQFNTERNISVQDYLKMIYKKTSFLLVASIKMGALVGNASDEVLNSLEKFAENLGLGFQLQDDLLDLISDNPKFGKIKGQDLIEGKKTYLVIEANRRAVTNSDRVLMDDYYSSQGLSEDKIPDMIDLMGKLGVFDDAKKLATDYFDKARTALKTLPDNKYRTMLEFVLEDIQIRTF